MANIHLESLINFYDRQAPGSSGHASAINGILGESMAIALMGYHFSRIKKIKFSCLNQRCTQGTRNGKRLDCWIELIEEGKKIHYQTEIKNWSSHSIGGKKSPSSEDESTMSEYRRNRWSNQFDNKNRTLKEESARKVLIPMRPIMNGVEIRPLICFWDAMSETGAPDEFFNVEINDKNFSKLWVFSMSNLIRNLLVEGKTTITVDLPKVDKTIDWLEAIYER